MQLAPGINGRQHGKGPPMLLIHGVGMCSDFWRNIEPALAQHFTLQVIDLPGHGESDLMQGYANATEDHPALSEYTDSIAAIMLANNKPCVVVGHSMGALISLDLAVRYSDAVSGIAVLNGVYRRTKDAQRSIDSRVKELRAALQNQNSNAAPAKTKQTLDRWFGTKPTGVNADASALCQNWLLNANPLGYLQAYAAFAKADAPSNKQLQTINCPALFLTGSLEPNSTPEMSTTMSQHVKGAECVIIKDAKHMMSMTHGEMVTSSITSYFKPLLAQPAPKT